MAFRYLSKEWLADGRRRLEASPDFPAAAKGLTTSLLNVITETPDGKPVYLYYRFQDGSIMDADVGTEASIASKPHEFKATGTLETYRLINQGKLTSTQAVFQRRIKLEGNLGKALRHVRPLEVFNKILREVPTEY